jgi:hypothetical protein
MSRKMDDETTDEFLELRHLIGQNESGPRNCAGAIAVARTNLLRREWGDLGEPDTWGSASEACMPKARWEHGLRAIEAAHKVLAAQPRGQRRSAAQRFRERGARRSDQRGASPQSQLGTRASRSAGRGVVQARDRAEARCVLARGDRQSRRAYLGALLALVVAENSGDASNVSSHRSVYSEE